MQKLNRWIKNFLHRSHYVLVFLIVLVAAIFVTFLLVSNGSEDWKLLLPLVGGAISLIYIIEKQHLDEATLFANCSPNSTPVTTS